METLVLRESDAATLAQAADDNFATHASWLLQHTPGMHVAVETDLVMADCGLPCDTFNVVCRARLDEHAAPERARAVLAHFERVQRPFSWWLGPADRPRGLGDMLSGLGLAPAESECAMAVDLAQLGPHASPPRDLEPRRVRSRDELRVLARLSAANWEPPDRHVERFYELAARAALRDDCPLWFYVGYLDGEPVATAELTVGGGVAGLYGVATLAAHRRRGFGMAMTLAALLDARTAGHRTAILQAAAAGVGVYRRVGFEPFGTVTEYKPGSAGARDAGLS